MTKLKNKLTILFILCLSVGLAFSMAACGLSGIDNNSDALTATTFGTVTSHEGGDYDSRVYSYTDFSRYWTSGNDSTGLINSLGAVFDGISGSPVYEAFGLASTENYPAMDNPFSAMYPTLSERFGDDYLSIAYGATDYFTHSIFAVRDTATNKVQVSKRPDLICNLPSMTNYLTEGYSPILGMLIDIQPQTIRLSEHFNLELGRNYECFLGFADTSNRAQEPLLFSNIVNFTYNTVLSSEQDPFSGYWNLPTLGHYLLSADGYASNYIFEPNKLNLAVNAVDGNLYLDASSSITDGYWDITLTLQNNYGDTYILPSFDYSNFFRNFRLATGIEKGVQRYYADLSFSSKNLIDYFDLQSGYYRLYMTVVKHSIGLIPPRVDSSLYFSNIVEFLYAAPAELPPDPFKLGYYFAGWYYNEELTIPYNGEPITTETKLYARFNLVQYTISYNLNGGTLTSGWTSYTIESAAYTLPLPTRNGYDFIGWYTNSGFTGSAVTQIVAGSYGDKSFYAKFAPTAYTITYELNGGSLTGQTTGYNTESATITLLSPSKNGYTFSGWYTNSVFSNSPVSSVPTGSTGNKVFYAKYTAINYAITYHLGGGTLTGHKTQYTIEDAAYTLPTPTLEGFNFKGWFLDSTLTGSAVTTIQLNSTGNKVYYAKWELITYKVMFFVDGVLYKEMTVGYGSVLDGYYFVNSQMAAVSLYSTSDRTTTYDLKQGIYEDTVIFTDSAFDLFVSLTYSVNGLEMATDLLEYNAPITNLRTYEAEGYTFGGWFYDAAFSRPVLETDKLVSNVTIYAKLTEIEPEEKQSFFQKVGAWLTSTAGIIIVVVVGLLIVLGGVGFGISKKKK